MPNWLHSVLTPTTIRSGMLSVHMPFCPDCDVEMNETEHKTSYRGDGIRIESGSGLLGMLDLKGPYLTSYICPDCGLARYYADT